MQQIYTIPFRVRACGFGAACLLSVGACSPAPDTVSRGAVAEQDLAYTDTLAPKDAPEGSCWGKYVTPARIETVTRQTLLSPPELDADGKIITPASYGTESEHVIVEERKERFFETPCREEMNEDFIATLQRALSARGEYTGPVTGEMNAKTRRAVRRFQSSTGLDSEVLSLEAARQLGVSAYGRDEA